MQAVLLHYAGELAKRKEEDIEAHVLSLRYCFDRFPRILVDISVKQVEDANIEDEA